MGGGGGGGSLSSEDKRRIEVKSKNLINVVLKIKIFLREENSILELRINNKLPNISNCHNTWSVVSTLI